MRRAMMYAGCVGVVMLAALVVSWGSRAAAPPKGKEAPAGEAVATQLPIGQVVLFSSGVGYFQREGSVDGTARVDLTFPVGDINDLIKSMVLRDLDGGHIAAVSYDSNAPIERTLRSFAVNLTGNPGFAELLNQARGERVEVALLNAAGAGVAGNLTGSIVGVERQRQTIGKDVVDVQLLNLWCSDGMRSVKLAEVQRVRFLNPHVEREFRQALETLAFSHDTQKKAVSIRFVGEGKRRVRVGYVIENPIWKTSYRLVLGQEAADRPYLQGWAVVENPTDEDWREVRMALISGRPISFQMDLYTPLYVPRPTVVPELFASLRPVTYSGRMLTETELGLDSSAPLNYNVDRIKGVTVPGGVDPRMARRPPAMKKGTSVGKKKPEELREELAQDLQLGRSVSTAASAARLGDFFQYLIEKPVSLPRQKSALLPIVGKDVQATRVSIYNERVQAKFPLLGLKFKNTSGLHLMQGPVTVFEGSTYAGDARVLDLQPNEERLLSYAVDLGTEVTPSPAQSNGRMTKVRAIKGLIHTETLIRETRNYQVTNRNDKERTLLVEHPVRHDFKLVGESKPVETASDVYRFQLKVPPGKGKTLDVTEERTIGSTVQLRSTSDDQIRIFLREPVLSDPVKKGLNRALTLRWDLAKTQREIAELQRQLNIATQDQARLRANLRDLPRTSKTYDRTVTKIDERETEIERYQADIKRLQNTEHQQAKAFEDFLVSFTAE